MTETLEFFITPYISISIINFYNKKHYINIIILLHTKILKDIITIRTKWILM